MGTPRESYDREALRRGLEIRRDWIASLLLTVVSTLIPVPGAASSLVVAAPPAGDTPGTLQLKAAAIPSGLWVEVRGESALSPVTLVRASSIAALTNDPPVVWSGEIPGGRTNVVLTREQLGNGDTFIRARWEPALPNPDPARWAWAPPGTFLQGSPTSEAGHQSDEAPLLRAVLREGFYIRKQETTQAEYVAVMGDHPSPLVGPDLPVSGVSWEKATDYCARLTAQERAAGRLSAGFEYRLPTEAEWEYAARAGTRTAFPYGNGQEEGQMSEGSWYAGNAEGRPHPVGTKAPNPWGLHDTHGNVAEWCLDFYAAPLGGTDFDPRGPSVGEFHVIRGGSYRDEMAECRSAFRRYDWEEEAPEDMGFRVVLAAIVARPGETPIEMVEVPPGIFRLGSEASEPGHQRDEGPVMEVTITRGFHMSRHEITQGQYVAVMGANPSTFSTGQGRRPVETVTWVEADAFCRRLTERESAAGTLPEGWGYRLPTEAEWEYVTRAGTSSAYPFGEDPGHRLYPLHARAFTSGWTHLVGSLEPNPWGFYDLLGNVAEWCADGADLYPGGPVLDPGGPPRAVFRVARGGGYSDDPEFLRSATRWSFLEPESRLANLGFRIVLARTAPPAVPSMDWVEVTPGIFRMGSSDAEAGRSPDEGPVSRVTVSRRFLIARREVIQAQYQEVMGLNPSFFTGHLNRPVEGVSWADATEFCRRWTEMERQAGRLPEGYVCRLPTEAEWEFAARGGSTTRFSHGVDLNHALLPRYATFVAGPTSGAGAKLANPLGLHDVHGNVREWCLDGYAPYPAGPRTDPVGPANARNKAVRGGGWSDEAKDCRSAARGFADPASGSPLIGFRVVLGAPVP